MKASVVIPMSKTRVAVYLAATLAGCIVALTVLLNAGLLSPVLSVPDQWIRASAALVLIALAPRVAWLVKRLRDKRPGLILSDDGLTELTDGVSAGKVPWQDIEDAATVEVRNRKVILVHVRNPENYINRHPNKVKRQALKVKHCFYGTPVAINPSSLKITLEELHRLLTDRLDSYRPG